MTVQEDLDDIVEEALDRFDKNGPEDAEAWFIAEFRTRSGVPELVNENQVFNLSLAIISGRKTFEAALRQMADRAVQQHPRTS